MCSNKGTLDKSAPKERKPSLLPSTPSAQGQPSEAASPTLRETRPRLRSGQRSGRPRTRLEALQIVPTRCPMQIYTYLRSEEAPQHILKHLCQRRIKIGRNTLEIRVNLHGQRVGTICNASSRVLGRPLRWPERSRGRVSRRDGDAASDGCPSAEAVEGKRDGLRSFGADLSSVPLLEHIEKENK